MKSGRIKRITFGLSAVAVGVMIIASQNPAPQPTAEQLPVQKNAPEKQAQAVAKVSQPTTATEPSAARLPDFAAITDVAEKKTAFFNYLRPKVEQQNALIADDRAFVEALAQKIAAASPLSEADSERVTALAARYRLDLRQLDSSALAMLLARVDTLPIEMVLVQAANESAWGTSRFAKMGNNLFGQWCFSKGCGLVPNSRTAGLQHEVAKFDSIDASVRSYLLNINTNAAYQQLRDVRAQLRAAQQPVTADKLIPTLLAYSERKEAYVEELLAMLRHNQRWLKS